MSVGTQTAHWPPPRDGGENATRESLDALAVGRCSPDEFLREILERFREDRNGKWEVLSLLDQYYRRGKIKADVFQLVKSQLAESALGSRDGNEPYMPPSVTTVVTAPAGVSRQNTSAGVKSTSRSRAREVASGDVLRGRYRILEALGQGGMGTVFAAIDDYRLDLPETGQRVAVKVLHTSVTVREELVAELQREFQHLQLLSHPNIVRVHEFDRDGDVAFFTMEALTGALLSRVLEARNSVALARPYALAVIREIGAALAYAHSRGVVHGDINPQNVFLTNDGELRVLDFGASHKLPSDTGEANGDEAQRLPVATLGYASCQLLEGQRPDARDDVFAFACLAYVLLAGTHPFPNFTAIEAAARRWTPRRPPGLSGHQWRALREGLRWDREQRPSEVQEWLGRLDLRQAAVRLPPLPGLLKSPPPRKSRLMLATAAVLLAALLLATGFWAFTDYDSLTGRVGTWTTQARSGLAAAGDSLSRLFDKDSPTANVANVADAPQAPAASRAVPAMPPAATPPASASPGLTSSATASPPTTSSHAAPSHAAPTPSAVHAGPAGPARVEMVVDTVDVSASETTARVTVHRKGNMHGEAGFKWWTESGTAKPGVDFSPVTPRIATLEDGAGSGVLIVPVSNTPRTQPKSFYVVIDEADPSAVIGSRTLTMVTLLPPDN